MAQTLHGVSCKVCSTIPPKLVAFGFFILAFKTFTIIPGVPKKVHNFVDVLFNLETRYMNKLCSD